MRDRLLGSWTLLRAEVVDKNRVVDPMAFGPHPAGFIHYLPNGLMAALIAPDNACAVPPAAAGFMGYGGSYTVLSDRVVHHVRINSRSQDVGTDYVRLVSWQNSKLWLATPDPPVSGQRAMRLLWSRLD